MKQKISELFDSTKADAVLLRNSSSAWEQNFYYYSKLPFGFYSSSFLILKKGKKPVLLTTKLEGGKALGTVVKKLDSKKQFEKTLQKELKGIKKIGLNFDLYPKNAFSNLKKVLPK
ncbi:MAG: aminopeptidase P family N-terminal domain-containing protein, partial [Candidatus Diapherotrites archaeon]|nr:aminopeptidase P family N-terminal domain-containing protein [Candidatus Diapherotrites archaeon]